MTNTTNFQINTAQLMLTAEFNEAQIDLAVSTFAAVVVENKVA